MQDKPKSWWRKLLGYKAILVIDELEFGVSDTNPRFTGVHGKIVDHHYEWQWRPFRKKRLWKSGPWTKFR